MCLVMWYTEGSQAGHDTNIIKPLTIEHYFEVGLLLVQVDVHAPVDVIIR